MKHVHGGKERTALVLRLRKIRGQIDGIARLVEADADCTEVLNQVISARSALKSLGDKIIQSHVRDCIETVPNAAQSRRNLRSLLIVLERYVH